MCNKQQPYWSHYLNLYRNHLQLFWLFVNSHWWLSNRHVQLALIQCKECVRIHNANLFVKSVHTKSCNTFNISITISPCNCTGKSAENIWVIKITFLHQSRQNCWWEIHESWKAVEVIWLIYKPELLFTDMSRKQEILTCKQSQSLGLQTFTEIKSKKFTGFNYNMKLCKETRAKVYFSV